MIKNKNIIVIGSGSSILDKEYGEIIDSFKEVVRFNNFQIKGYEKQIGTKTTIWARSNSRRTKERNWEQFKKVIVASPAWNYKNLRKIIRNKKNAYSVPKEDAFRLQKELKLPGFKNIRKNGKRKKIRGWPTTGIMVLDYLLKQYSIVYIHGFDNFKKINGKARHYYNNLEPVGQLRSHDSEKEKEWIEKKIKNNRIKRLKDIYK